MKPDRLMLAFFDLSVHNVQYLFINNRNIALIYSVIIFEQKKDSARSGSFQHKLHHRCFHL